jgi:DNA-binding SARP family transcriptional activator
MEINMVAAHLVQVKLLGDFAISVSTRTAAVWRPNRARTLFGVLLVNHEMLVPRERLEGSIWPASGRPAGATSLKVTVHALRKELDLRCGGDRDFLVVESRDHGYLLHVGPGVAVDFHDFEQLLQHARERELRGRTTEAVELYRKAMDLYCGDFLSADRDEWAVEQREWLRSSALRALDVLATNALRFGDAVACSRYCHRTIAIEPANERAFRLLMVVHARRGELDQVKNWYALCTRRLQDYFEVEPADDTRRLLLRALAGEYREPISRSPGEHRSGRQVEPHGLDRLGLENLRWGEPESYVT